MARFEREAKLPASLNHPNIAAISGSVTAIQPSVQSSTLVEATGPDDGRTRH
jgi:hypothetical protein